MSEQRMTATKAKVAGATGVVAGGAGAGVGFYAVVFANHTLNLNWPDEIVFAASVLVAAAGAGISTFIGAYLPTNKPKEH